MKTNILNILFAASMTLTIGLAQSAAATPSLQHASPVAAPTYLGLSYVQGALQVSINRTDAAKLSPKVQTIAFKNGQRPSGFLALHADITLSEVVSYYWDALSELGFTSSMDTGSRRVTSYRFENGNSRLMAVFTQNGDNVVADLSWIGTELTTTAN